MPIPTGALVIEPTADGFNAAAGHRWLGTLAQVNPEGLAPLSLQEQEHLLTRAATPYRDPP